MSDTASAETGTESAQTDGAEQQQETPTVESLTAALDKITAEARKWEGRAKENFDARKELETIRAASMTEAELARYKIAAEFHLDQEDTDALASVSDEATLRALAERLAGRSSTSGPRPNPSQGKGGAAGPLSPAEAFAEAMDGLF